MSIETKTDEHDEQRRQLHRWACLPCSKRGMWLRDHDQAREGMRAHLSSRQHLERQRQLEQHRAEHPSRPAGPVTHLAVVVDLEAVAVGMDDSLLCGCHTEVRGDELHVIPCTEEHGRQWAELLPLMLADRGIAIPIEVEE